MILADLLCTQRSCDGLQGGGGKGKYFQPHPEQGSSFSLYFLYIPAIYASTGWVEEKGNHRDSGIQISMPVEELVEVPPTHTLS